MGANAVLSKPIQVSTAIEEAQYTVSRDRLAVHMRLNTNALIAEVRLNSFQAIEDIINQ